MQYVSIEKLIRYINAGVKIIVPISSVHWDILYSTFPHTCIQWFRILAQGPDYITISFFKVEHWFFSLTISRQHHIFIGARNANMFKENACRARVEAHP